MTFRVLLRRFREKVQQDGLIEALQGAKRFLVGFVESGFTFPEYQENVRTDTAERINLIDSHVDDDNKNLLEIGCAEGSIVKHFAERGLFSVGLDLNRVRIARARKKKNTRMSRTLDSSEKSCHQKTSKIYHYLT